MTGWAPPFFYWTAQPLRETHPVTAYRVGDYALTEVDGQRLVFQVERIEGQTLHGSVISGDDEMDGRAIRVHVPIIVGHAVEGETVE